MSLPSGFKNRGEYNAYMRKYRQRRKNYVPCCMCDKRGLFKEIQLSSDPLIRTYICDDCLEKLPSKLKGLRVKFKGQVIGEVASVDLEK